MLKKGNHLLTFDSTVKIGCTLVGLRSPWRPVPYLSFEVNLPEFKPEGLDCIALLGRMAADGRFKHAAEV